MTFWTPARVEELRRLAPDYSAGQIALRWGVTRNVVCGGMYRFKIPPRLRKPARTSPLPIKLRPIVKTPNPIGPRMKPPVPSQAPETIACEPLPDTAVTLADLTATTCRFPLWAGHEPSSERRYCGGKSIEGAPYCGHHCRMAYTGRERDTLPTRVA